MPSLNPLKWRGIFQKDYFKVQQAILLQLFVNVVC